jgi:hypothetical protein
MAMVVASFKDSSITPVEAAKWAVDNGYRAEGDGTYRTYMINGAKHYGLNVEAIGNDGVKLVEALKAGKLAIAIMAPGHFTKYGHYLVLRGVTAEGKILVADSGSRSRTEKEWDLKLILNETSRNTASGGPIWVYSP